MAQGGHQWRRAGAGLGTTARSGTTTGLALGLPSRVAPPSCGSGGAAEGAAEGGAGEAGEEPATPT